LVGIRACRAVSGCDDPVSVEQELLRGARAGDVHAMERLLGQHEGSVYAVCRGMMGRAEDAEDAVQETFLRAMRSFGGFRGGARFHTWLFRIAINVCTDWKRARRSSELPLTADMPAATSPSPEASVIRLMRITEALQSLLPRRRAVFLLRELEGWSVAEIAAALRCNESKVYYELREAHRALAAWRERERAEGGEI
jgi:RNA polymerase sigma-70 factor, ECF subfamily